MQTEQLSLIPIDFKPHDLTLYRRVRDNDGHHRGAKVPVQVVELVYGRKGWYYVRECFTGEIHLCEWSELV